MKKILLILIFINVLFAKDQMISFSGEIKKISYDDKDVILDIKTRNLNNIKVKIDNTYINYKNYQKIMGNCLYKKEDYYHACYIFEI